MEFKRSAGMLLHPTSLPGKFGIGDLGANAFKFIDFLSDTRQTLWQVFPLGPTGYGDSPYQCFSAFAGNPLLINPELLVEQNLLSQVDLDEYPEYDKDHIQYGEVIKSKTELLKKAYENYKSNRIELGENYENFCEVNAEWLDDYSLFMAAKEFHGGVTWTEWSEDIAFRKRGAIKAWTEKLSDIIGYQKFVQYLFFHQWKTVKEYANSKNIEVIGDLPIFIAFDSADLWANKSLFSVNNKGKLETVAGVPPDYFSPTGQLWGNPLYKWDEMAKDDFLWWQKRFSKMYELVDIVRIDHFRGFDAYYEIPGDAPTAETGHWVDAPGMEFFQTIKDKLGDVKILAEDLGIITPTVEKLRDHFNFPGMKILQFAFGKDGDKKFLPHNHIQNCVVYTGSHDNDTTKGFFDKEKVNGSDVYDWAQKYLGFYQDDMCHALIKAAYASVANIVVIPLQDVMNLGTEARMNFPGKLGGNWTWRFSWEDLNGDTVKYFKEIVDMYERDPYAPKVKNEEIVLKSEIEKEKE